MKYYPIDESLARQAKEMNSFYDYQEGSATAAYRQEVDKAVQLAEAQKQKVAPMYHEKIDRLLDAYARRLAENTNKSNAIACRVPSILIAGGSNFPARKKEKQNRAADANMAEWREIQGLLDKIRGTGMGGISADDPEVLQKLKTKLESHERLQDHMKAVNAYYRKHKTLEGCPGLDSAEIEKLKASMVRDWRADPKPYPSFRLTNNNAVIRQTRQRIEEMSARAEVGYEGWAFDGGTVEANQAANRLQITFDEKPDADTRAALKGAGFRWAPSAGVWQRQLNNNALRAAKRLEFLRSLSPEPQERADAEPVPQPETGWCFYIIADLKTWAENAADRSPLEHFASFEEAKARFDELRCQDYNSEITESAPDERPPARLTLGLESADGLSAMDILHVRQGKNYLVMDFTQSERMREDPSVSEILSRISKEIGFDLVQPFGQPPAPFEEWDNPYFSSATPGSIAARYYDFLHECYPLPKDKTSRYGQIREVVRFLQKEGKNGANQMTLAAAAMVSATDGISETAKMRADALVKELAMFKGSGKEQTPQKGQRRKSPER